MSLLNSAKVTWVGTPPSTSGNSAVKANFGNISDLTQNLQPMQFRMELRLRLPTAAVSWKGELLTTALPGFKNPLQMTGDSLSQLHLPQLNTII